MIDNSFQKTIQDHMKTLPVDVQEAIHTSSWERKILNIWRKYGLHVDQLEILQTELSLAVLGLSNREDFVRETIREARIDKQTMDMIVEDINREIFEDIRNHLKQTRERDYKIEREEDPLDGLHREEEETLRKHGISFDLNEEQEDRMPVLGSKQTTSESVEASVEEKSAQPILENPVRLTKNLPSSSGGTSFSDILNPKNETPEQKQDTPLIEKDTTNKIPEPPKNQNPFHVEIDPNTLPSAVTQENQSKIGETKKPFYEKSDPYREPIT